MSYTLPTYHEGKSCYVDFFCYDPAEGKMRRKKFSLDKYKTAKMRRAYAAELIGELTVRLRSGWNVWATAAESTRQYVELEQVGEYYGRYLEKLVLKGTLRDSTRARYISYYGVWERWRTQVAALPPKCAYQLTAAVVEEFLDYVFLDLDLSAQTRNNYLTWLGTFCEWMRSKGYLSANPCEGVKSLREAPKKREPLSTAMLKALREYLEERNRHFLLACMLEYYTFIRPNELRHVRVCDIRVREQKIMLSGAFTKNRKDAVVAVPVEVIRLMIDLGIFSYPSKHFLFGSTRFTPSERRMAPCIFRNEFARVRKALGWADCYQFYSLKDTGIRDLANAEGVVVARDQARHSDVHTTNKYLKADALAVHEEVKRFKGGL